MKTLPSLARLTLATSLLTLAAALFLNGCACPCNSTDSSSTKTMKLEHKVFGKTPDGADVKIYTLSNTKGMTAKIMEYGAILTELWVPDRNGKPGNVVLGFDNLDSYVKGHPFFGAIAGRVANRIAGAKFTIDGVEYKVTANSAPNHIHGGRKGFRQR